MAGECRVTMGIALGGAFLLLLGGCHRRAVESPPATAVYAATLKPESILAETRISATVRERRRIEVSFKVPGTVAMLLQVPGPDGKLRDVHEGDVIAASADRPLARLDDSDYRRALSTTGERLAQARAKEQTAQANVTEARAEFERMKSLLEKRVVPQQTFDTAQAKRDAGEAELEAARHEIRATLVAQEQAADDLKNCALISPLPEATVSVKYIEGGERVTANQPVFQVLDLSNVRVAFGVPDTKIGEFSIGQALGVTADAFPGRRFAGRVTKINPSANAKTRSFEIEVTIDEPQGLKPGMVVTILVGRTETAVLAPMTAIVRGTLDEYAVFIVADENGKKVAHKRRVTLSGVFDNRVRLAEGGEVRAGDAVVVSGAFRLSEGQAVRVVDVPQAALNIGSLERSDKP